MKPLARSNQPTDEQEINGFHLNMIDTDGRGINKKTNYISGDQ